MGVIHIQRSCRHCGAQTFADWVLCRWKCPELPDPGAVGKSTVTYEIGQASALLSVLQSYGGHIPVGAAAAHRSLPAKRMRPSPSRYQRTQSDAEETGTARLVRRSIELVLINGSQSQLLREHHSGTSALGHRWGAALGFKSTRCRGRGGPCARHRPPLQLRSWRRHMRRLRLPLLGW